MCGIVGWVDWVEDLRGRHDILETMTETLRPRGPDAGGTWSSDRALIGHRRLAVIDIAGGVQPMAAGRPGEKECVLTFAGEIYNFVELRSELRTRGHQFRTRSDTEVLLHSYLEWGPDCVARLRGMFSFGIWDPRNETLLLGRDRLGVKPLYYHKYDNGVIFGSEHKALLAHPRVEAEIDLEGLNELLFMVQTPGHAVFRGIRTLRPGHFAVIDRNGVRESAYWGLESAPHEHGSDATVATVRRLLETAVDDQLFADVPVGTLLSGGLDSSVVTALSSRTMERYGQGPVYSFAIDFSGNEDNFQPTLVRPERDTPFAREAASFVGSKHAEILVTTDEVLDAQSQVVEARDLPGMADLNAAQFLLFRELRKSITVALSGEAADEVFGGYPWFHLQQTRDTASFPWASAFQGFSAILEPGLATRLRTQEYIDDGYQQAMAAVPRLPGESGESARMRELFYLFHTRWMPLLLDYKDRMSMRTGIEVRVPFCDHRLVEYLWNVPWELKNLDGWNKGLLRSAAADLLPDSVLDRQKASFPISQDPAYHSAMRARMADELADPNTPLEALINLPAIREMLDADGTVTGHWWRSTDTFALLLQIAHWLRTYRVRLV